MRQAYDSVGSDGRAWRRAPCGEQSSQRPKIAKCFMSVSKPNVVAQLGGEVGGHRDVRLDHVRAVPADQVDVVVPVGEVVRRRAVPEMGMADQPELLQQLQRPVDGGDVDPRRRPPHLHEDVVGGRVLKGVHGFEHELALRRQPVAALPQVALPVGAHHTASVAPGS